MKLQDRDREGVARHGEISFLSANDRSTAARIQTRATQTHPGQRVLQSGLSGRHTSWPAFSAIYIFAHTAGSRIDKALILGYLVR